MLASCSEWVRETPWLGEAPETDDQKKLCEFGKVYSPTMIVRYHEADEGRLFFGDITNFQAFADNDWTTVRSAMARPEETVYEQKVRTDCYNEATDRYYPCIRKLQIDLGEVGAVVRSNFADPTEMALRYCSEAARNAWKEQARFAETNESQDCVVTVRALCPLPHMEKSQPEPE
ncbi:MAG: hypothetical protein GY789_11080 [Hyphomicrobiales bacterium]|nr:hypothetical protein [Hyphomicrobiales bacterium]